MLVFMDFCIKIEIETGNCLPELVNNKFILADKIELENVCNHELDVLIGVFELDKIVVLEGIH